MKILVIDDDVLMRRTIARILTAEGHDLLTAPDTARGVTLFGRERPEIVIAEGIDTILAMRRIGAPVKIIAITAYDADMLETVRLLGADDAIEKPFRTHELVERVRALCRAPTTN
jgi:DNA-binding response OmpR family regulator